MIIDQVFVPAKYTSVLNFVTLFELYNRSQWMHPPTQKIFLESVDASPDPKTRVGGCIHRSKKLESVDASADPKTRVGGCIHRLKN